MNKLRVLDLFSGIGGFSLGLERAGGFQTVAFCEIEEYPRKVLAKHWPEVPIYEDVRTLTADALARDGIRVDVICGGFPCQDISFAGRRAGLEGARSGLWSEYARLIGELRPRFVIVENVPGLLSLGMGAVLGDLAALGYNATWDCIPACAVGAPHRRDRVWIVGHTDKHGKPVSAVDAEASGMQDDLADSDNARLQGRNFGKLQERACEWTARTSSPSVADSNCVGSQAERNGQIDATALGNWQADRVGSDGQMGDPARSERAWLWSKPCREQSGLADAGWWQSEPDVGRVVARISSWMDGGRIENANACKGGTAEILRAMQRGDQTQSLQWSSRGFRGVQAAEILLADVCQYEGPPKPLGNVSLACQGASEGTMRGLWFDGKASCASCRRSAQEQRARKHPDAMCVVSQLLTCNCRSAWLDPTGATGTVRRVERIKGLGNAVVPQIPELIGRAIMQAVTP